MNADSLRDKFLVFFKAKKHKIIESDSLLPQDDPTVLFTPAGMNQFKKQFLGRAGGFRRAATAQRCLRTDDLDKVGKTPGHHTFFEMLGNFSFGDYFKEEAIVWAWEFLTQELNIKKDKLWASVYQDDAEAYRLWKDKIKLAAGRIIKLGDKENFWPAEAKEKGPNGPCGPCSEIFFDQGSDVGCRRANCDPSCPCGRFVEVWNLVFTQFNRKEGGILEPLPQKNIDTGMGLERLAAVIEGRKNNFETELFQPLIKEIAPSTEHRTPNQKELIYAVSDHIRAIVFAIYDGALPANEARGYVVRKLIRKSVLHLRALGIERPFLYKLAPVLAEIMKHPYPQLIERRENIAEIILAEEKNFINTLNTSDNLLSEKFKDLTQKDNPQAAGRMGFELYDTYGVPWELTAEWLEKNKISFSPEAFEQELEKQKSRSKLSSIMKGEVFSKKELVLGINQTKFFGYKENTIRAKVLKIISGGEDAKRISKDDTGQIILDKTVFYAEAGGQVGDTGELVKGKNIFEVLDSKKIDKVVIHIGRVKAGIFKPGDLVSAKIDFSRRRAIARNHTATHLLQAALRKVLGPHVRQQGSLVAPDKLRFDFTHFKGITAEQLARIEYLVNDWIMQNYPLRKRQMPLSQAKKSGALAFFAEKYESRVRVVSVADISTELCGGTHLDYTGGIGLFKITQEGSVASGVRRIEAVTAGAAYKIIKDQDKMLAELSAELGVPQDKIISAIDEKLSRLRELEKQLNSRKLEAIADSVDNLLKAAEKVNNLNLITRLIENLDLDGLRRTVDLVKEKSAHSVVALGSAKDGRALLVVGVTGDLCQQGLDAAKLILAMTKLLGGSGGGRPDFAQAGGNSPAKFPEAFRALKNTLANLKL